MAQGIAALLLVAAAGSCMEMRETVERMVMVRTTGSDLQPAATGYIYKKGNDGTASVVEMGESEVMEHLSKLYEQPESFAAPIPVAASAFYAKQEDEDKAASHAEQQIIPVVEKPEDHGEVDGLADEEEGYSKIFKEYANDFGDYDRDFSDYLHGLGSFEHGIYHGGYGGGSDYGAKEHEAHGDKGFKGYASKHHYGKGGAGDYHTEKYESYSVSGGGHKKGYDDSDAYGKDFAQGHEYKGGDHGHKAGHSEGEEIDGYHKVFDKDEYKKDHDVYDAEKVEGGFNKHADGLAYHGSDAGGYAKGGSGDSGHDEGSFGKGGFHKEESGDGHGAERSSEEGGQSWQHYESGSGAEGGSHGGKAYGFNIKHR